MKEIHVRDDKNRLRISASIKKHLPQEQKPLMFFLGDHITICGETRFEKMVEELAGEIGSEEVARTVLSAESKEFRSDNQDRTVIPQEYLTGELVEQEVYIITVKGKTKEDNYIEIFPKTVYDNLINDVIKDTNFLKYFGLKGKLKELKGEGNEEGRRKD